MHRCIPSIIRSLHLPEIVHKYHPNAGNHHLDLIFDVTTHSSHPQVKDPEMMKEFTSYNYLHADLTTPIFRSARTSCTTFDWSTCPCARFFSSPSPFVTFPIPFGKVLWYRVLVQNKRALSSPKISSVKGVLVYEVLSSKRKTYFSSALVCNIDQPRSFSRQVPLV